MASHDILVRLRAIGTRVFQSDMDKSAKSVEGVGASSAKTAKSAGKSFAKWAAASGAVAAGTKVLKDSVKNAVDLGEQINKTATVFRGPGANAIKQWSKTTATGIGVSQAQALEAAGTFGNMLVPMGIARTQAAGMSKNMVNLAGDMASFNNASPEQTLDALRSGLAGETEPLRRFGVFLSQSRIQAEAMSMGLVKATKDTGGIKAAQMSASIAQAKYSTAVKKHGKNSLEARSAAVAQAKAEAALSKVMRGKVPALTATQKAQATYALILKDTKDAQNDFAKTSDSLANKQRILKAQYANITAVIGAKLVPVIQLLANNLTIVAAALGVVITLWASYRAAVLIAQVAQSLFNVTLATMPIFLVIAGIAALVAGFILLYKKVDWFRAGVDAAFAGVVAAFNWVKNAAVDVFNWIKGHWPFLLLMLLNPFAAAVLVIIKNWDKIKAAAANAVKAIGAAVGKIPGLVAKAFSDAVSKAKSIVSSFPEIGKQIVKALVSGITSAPGAILSAIKSLLPGGKVGKKLMDAIPGLAAGGIVRSPLQIVGERGPELAALPMGTRVFPSHASLPAPAIAGGGPMTANLYLDRRLVASAVAQRDSDVRARR